MVWKKNGQKQEKWRNRFYKTQRTLLIPNYPSPGAYRPLPIANYGFIKHRAMAGKEEVVKDTLFQPDEIRRSKIDENVFLYYKRIGNKLYCAVARHEGKEGYLITAYTTDKVKEGEVIWTK